jgi:DNA-binding transcriptional ArsR family regulator
MEHNLSMMMRNAGEGSRARLLCLLMDGRAFTGKELASFAGIAPSTASEHLSNLQTTGLIRAQKTGRSTYFVLSGPDVAAALEGMTALLPPAPEQTGPIAKARCCYDHLAGDLGVMVANALVHTDVLARDAGQLVKGQDFDAGLRRLGLALPQGRPAVRSCLDWTARRAHVAGGLGAAVLAQALSGGWVTRGKTLRVLHITSVGLRAFADVYGIEILP